MMIDYNENRKDLQIDKLHEDLVVELEAKASQNRSDCGLLHRRVH
jgi:hypothetical protein